jgi:hypothetical protein
MQRFYFDKNSGSLKMTRILFFCVTLLVLVLWVASLFLNSELALVARYFLPVLLVLGILGTIFQTFIAPKLYYVELGGDSLTIRRVIGTTLEYSKIKKVNINGDVLDSIDTGSYAPWPIYLRLEDASGFSKAVKGKIK